MFVLIDNNSGAGGPSLIFEDPLRSLIVESQAGVGEALLQIEAATAQGLYAAGFFSYELGYALEPRLAPQLPASRQVPLLWFGIFREPRKLTDDDVLAFLSAASDGVLAGPPRPLWQADDYTKRFVQAKQHIEAGDIYQLNLTFPVELRLEGSPLGLYRQLRKRQPVAHGAYLDTGQHRILSLSPEQFYAREGSQIVSRPMKGTAARGLTTGADARARAELAGDAKQRAENLMIVDLMRNDIGRMAEIGSVLVSDLFTVETFRTVHQMTSGIEARLRPGVSLSDSVRALFPPGSVTGAPKIKAMELISELEAAPRGIYCGAIGYAGPGNVERFNVAIRTLVFDATGQGSMGLGSAVVADSDAAAEYAECLLKMSFLSAHQTDFELIETMLYQPGNGLWLLDRHLDRLARSARHFGFKFDENRIRSAGARPFVAVEGWSNNCNQGANAGGVTRKTAGRHREGTGGKRGPLSRAQNHEPAAL